LPWARPVISAIRLQGLNFWQELAMQQMTRNSRRATWWAWIALALCCTGGCAWFQQGMETLKGPGFPGWEESGNGIRAKNADAKPSGFFTDRRSEQIEKNLGGNF
jgi:hypothetical protein